MKEKINCSSSKLKYSMPQRTLSREWKDTHRIETVATYVAGKGLYQRLYKELSPLYKKTYTQSLNRQRIWIEVSA